MKLTVTQVVDPDNPIEGTLSTEDNYTLSIPGLEKVNRMMEVMNKKGE